MTENKRFLIDDAGELIDFDNHKFIDYGDECCKLLNELHDENEKLKIFLKAVNEELSLANRDNDTLEEENKALQQKLHLVHMSSMFSTVKSFKGDISKRYKYNEKTDMIYDTANHYGEYNKVLGKKEITMLLNEYNTLLEGSNEECF